MLAISIHAAREGGDLRSSNYKRKMEISIHAAREGGDVRYVKGAFTAAISIHAAREGGDSITVNTIRHSSTFQSTPPVKAATQPCSAPARQSRISIHAAREGGDFSDSRFAQPSAYFNPRRP